MFADRVVGGSIQGNQYRGVRVGRLTLTVTRNGVKVKNWQLVYMWDITVYGKRGNMGEGWNLRLKQGRPGWPLYPGRTAITVCKRFP